MRRLRVLSATLVALAFTAAGQESRWGIRDEGLYGHEILRLRQSLAATQSASDTSIDVAYYKLNLTVTTLPDYLRGTVTVKALSRAATLSSVTLDLSNTMRVDSVVMGQSTVPFVQHPSTVTITLNRSYGHGEMVVLDVYFQGVPSSTGFGSFVFTTTSLGAPWVWSLSEPYGAKDWWPCKNHPSDKADSADIWVTVSTGLKVGSNGSLLSVVDNGNGTTTWKWSERYPIASYLISIAVSNYAAFSNWFRYSPVDSMEVLNYVLPEHLALGQANLPLVVGMLNIFSQKFGLYPFVKEKYGHSEIGWGGAMEHQTMTSANVGAFAEYVIAHELGHQWFGDFITCANWPNLWLNEGFATYCESVYFEQKSGSSSYWTDMLSKEGSAKNAVGTLYAADTSNIPRLFDPSLVYNKGTWVLHMLRHVLGDSTFFQSVRRYLDDPRLRYGVATTEDFQHACEEVSGRDLEYFFKQWIYGERYPTYVYSWSATPTGTGYQVSVKISQETGATNPAFFTMPLDFKLSASTWDTTVVLFHTFSGQEFTFATSHRPLNGELDPQKWILRDVHPANETPLPSQFSLEQNFPNPFNSTTRIGYKVATKVSVTLSVFDILGRNVAVLVNSVIHPGTYTVSWDASGMPSGLYFYRLQAGTSTETKKALLVR